MEKVLFKVAQKSKRNKKFRMMASNHKSKLLVKKSLNLWTTLHGKEKMGLVKIKKCLLSKEVTHNCARL